MRRSSLHRVRYTRISARASMGGWTRRESKPCGRLSSQGGEYNLDSDSVLIGVLRLIGSQMLVVSLPARSAGKFGAFLHDLQGYGA